jgi:hypothetical protein
MWNTGCIVPLTFVNPAIFVSPKKWAFALLLFMKLAKNHPVGQLFRALFLAVKSNLFTALP